MKDLIYIKHGKKYKKIKRDEIIEKGAMHSFGHGELMTIKNVHTIGDVPSNFSDERDFYNPIKDEA